MAAHRGGLEEVTLLRRGGEGDLRSCQAALPADGSSSSAPCTGKGGQGGPKGVPVETGERGGHPALGRGCKLWMWTRANTTAQSPGREEKAQAGRAVYRG